jgi:hypothetical protein
MQIFLSAKPEPPKPSKIRLYQAFLARFVFVVLDRYVRWTSQKTHDSSLLHNGTEIFGKGRMIKVPARADRQWHF